MYNFVLDDRYHCLFVWYSYIRMNIPRSATKNPSLMWENMIVEKKTLRLDEVTRQEWAWELLPSILMGCEEAFY